jgi:dGTPase
MRDLSANGPHKFGAYRSEEEQFNFARQYSIGENPSLEAQIMDWADDISYAVHDLEDFYRAGGMIPLDRLSKSKEEIRSFIDGMLPRLRDKITPADESDYEDTATRFLAFCPVSEAYLGKRTQRTALRGFASSIIHEAVSGTKISDNGLIRPVKIDREVTVLNN